MQTGTPPAAPPAVPPAAPPAVPPSPPALGATADPAAGDDARLAAEREADRKAYDAAIAGLRKDHAGEWVVIAEGAVAKVGATLADVNEIAPEALHRFVFEIGKEGDREEFVSQWYGPRFAGSGLAAALDVEWTIAAGHGTWLSKGGTTVGPLGVPPFPRVPVGLSFPWDGYPFKKSPGYVTKDVLVGGVGPPLMLMPEDWTALSLARSEVPGTMTVLGLPCRMANVDVLIRDLGATGRVIAACPAAPRETLIALARERDAFWNWGGDLGAKATAGHEGRWIVFAADRVIADGATPGEALRAAEGKPDGAYHRFVLPVPRGAPITYDAARFTTPNETFHGRLIGLEDPEGHVLIDREFFGHSGRELEHLEMAEDGREFAVVRDGVTHRARAGWLGRDIHTGRPTQYVYEWPDPVPPK